MLKIVTLIILLCAITHSENLLENLDSRFATKFELTNFINNPTFSDSLYIKSNTFSLKPMIASLIVPGFGQYLNHSVWWKKALFVGVEIVGIAGYISWTNKADNITKKYENWADEHWDMNDWVKGSAILLSDIQSSGYPDIDDVRIDGSHHITIIIDGKYVSSDILSENPSIKYVELRDWDFYEGIGKYDQFVAGWDDAKSNWKIINKNIEDGDDELIVMTPNKHKYLELRNNSNVLYKNAKFAASALIFNHIFSALDALLNTNKIKELSYKLDVSIGSESNYEIKGISVQWNL